MILVSGLLVGGYYVQCFLCFRENISRYVLSSSRIYRLLSDSNGQYDARILIANRMLRLKSNQFKCFDRNKPLRNSTDSVLLQ